MTIARFFCCASGAVNGDAYVTRFLDTDVRSDETVLGERPARRAGFRARRFHGCITRIDADGVRERWRHQEQHRCANDGWIM
jgi:hypothetical protein